MKRFYFIFSLVLFLFSSCSENTGEINDDKQAANDSGSVSSAEVMEVTSVESELEEGDELPPLPAPAEEETLPLTEESLVGTWVCNASKHITLHANGEFETSSLSNDNGKWWLQDGVLYLKEMKLTYTEKRMNDTVKLFLNSVTTHKIILDSVVYNESHDFLCYTGSDYMVYKHLYRDRPFEGVSHASNIVGLWYNSEGIRFFEDGTVEEEGPDARTGKWYLEHLRLVIDFEDSQEMIPLDNISGNIMRRGESWLLYKKQPNEEGVNSNRSTGK